MGIPAGQRLGRYEIQALIGRGGMGEVYLATDTQLRRPVALKLLPMDAVPEDLRRFEQEAFAVSALNHPNILTLYEVADIEGRPFLVTEYVDGVPLRQRLNMAGFRLRELLDVAIQVASALGAAHAAGVIHRDVKPENVMLRRDGWVKVLDFGVAKLGGAAPMAAVGNLHDSPTHTAPGVLMGTPYYMSPEQARGLPVDARTDVWSLGCVIYEMTCGRIAFQEPTFGDVIAAILQKEPVALDTLAPQAPAALRRLVHKALGKERDERYAHAGEMVDELKELKSQAEFEAKLVGSETLHGLPPSGAHRAPLSTTVKTFVSTMAARLRRPKVAVSMLAVAAVAAGLSTLLPLAPRGEAAVGAIAVLPLAPSGPGEDLEYLSDGLSEGLIGRLSRFPEVKVIARSSAFQYKGKPIDPQEVGRRLGVQALVLGHVRRERAGEDLRITIELVNARDRTQLWSGEYRRPPSELQSVQEDIARTIGEELRLRTPAASTRRRAAADPEAYQLYLNGLYLQRSQGTENTRKALDYYNRAVTLDPRFALAWVGVGRCYHYLAANSLADAKESMALMKAAATRALEADPDLADAHLLLANIRRHEWAWAEAEREYKTALELDPSLAGAYDMYAYYLLVMRRPEEALAANRRAQDLDPLRQQMRAFEAHILYFAGRLADAEALLEDVLDVNDRDLAARIVLGYVYSAQGRHAEAIEQYRRALAIESGATSLKCTLAYSLARGGHAAEARALVKELSESRAYVSPFELAMAHVGLGEPDAAFALLEKAFADRHLQLQYLHLDPHFEDLRGDARFHALVRRVGLPG